MGYTAHERRRLALQGAVLNPMTEEFLARAGIGAGANILDLGCGVGDVALILGRLVGPGGRVTAIDVDADALQAARARAQDEGLSQIYFEAADIGEYRASELFDAVVGRHILIHAPDPAAMLALAAAQVHAAGIVAFQEYDLSYQLPNSPAKPLFEKMYQLIIDLFVQTGRANIGSRLFSMFQGAGLTGVQSRGEFWVDGGPDCPFYAWIAETVRSLLPKLEATGLARGAELDLDALAERMKQEALRVGGSISSPVMIGTFGRKAG
jgi:SAM-dependent methyltransferase